MHEHGRFREMLVMVDTCQAASLFGHIKAPGVTTIASSQHGQSSYSYHVDEEVGVAVVDRFSHQVLQFLSESPDGSMKDFADSWDPLFLHSNPVLDTSRMDRPPDRIALSDFFTCRQHVAFPAARARPADCTRPQALARPAWAGDNPRLLIDMHTGGLPHIPLRSIKNCKLY